MAKKKIEPGTDLTSILVSEINKLNKDEPVAYFLNDDDSPANVSGWVPTGSDILDIAISNRPYGGLPMGKIIEITGLEQSGKSLLCSHILAETQKLGGVSVFIDTEFAISREFLQAIGVDIEKMLYISADYIEQVFKYIETIVDKIRDSDKDRLVTIVVDSVAAAPTQTELGSEFKKDGYATEKAIFLSKAMRMITNKIGKKNITLIFTNQLRQKLNVMAFADPWTTSGGKAIAFHASVRLRLKTMKSIKSASNDRVIGVKVKAQVVKNRVGPPQTTAEIDIYFDRGIDNYSSWVTIMKDNKIVKTGGGGWYTFIDEDSGEELKFQSKEFNQLMESRPDIKEQMYKKICQTLIMEYRSDVGIDIDDIQYSDDSEA